jgi:AcrR family transcriptional regulator
MPKDSPPVASQRTRTAGPEADALLRRAAGVFRKHGLASATMAQVAAAAGMTRAELAGYFATKDLLAQAIFAETIRMLKAADSRAWPGYGAGMRRTLGAARSYEDGYVVLVRDAPQHPAHQSSCQALRRRSAQRLRALLWYPGDPPPAAERPAMLDVALEPMISFCITAIAHWVQEGDAANDDLFLRWCGQAMWAWRHNACELLNLDTPDQDWPFDTEAPG